jgi:anthranilate synthase component 1
VRLAKAGEAGVVVRRLDKIHDPIDLHARLGAPMLFRRTGGRAIILVDSALRLEASADDATYTALSETGSMFLSLIAGKLRRNVVGETLGRLHLRFSRCEDPDEAQRMAARTAFDGLREMTLGLSPIDRDEPFAVTALGMIGFDHVDMLETVPGRPASKFPDLLFDLAETLVVVEPGGAARILALAIGSDDPAEAHRQTCLAAERLARTVERCETPRPVPRVVPPSFARAEADMDDREFGAIVDQLKQHIAAGDIFQAVPSRTFRAPCANPLDAFQRLIAADPSAYQFAFESDHGVLIGASPETALEVRNQGTDRIVSVSPIAGTRPRGATDDEDDRNEADLRLDAKEVAEHMMLVDLARNDVARVARPGTRRTRQLLAVERFAKVMHLVSTVEAVLEDGRDVIDAIRACLNVGTLSGAPKLKAIELIRRFEQSARGPYGGAVGWISGDGSMDSAVAIRSALVRDGIAEVRVGAGIVADSDPATEAAETRAKASAVLAALEAAA